MFLICGELSSWSKNIQFLSLLGPAGQAIVQELNKKKEYEQIKVSEALHILVKINKRDVEP